MEFSTAQKNAIYTHGDSLLVSAAAGSGKTAVLVERVIQKVLEGGDISKLWIMTFTEAAASEMRQKIEKAVEKQLEADPQNEHLQQQMLLMSAARISTVHSTCKYIIGQHFDRLGLDPATVIGDQAALEILFENLLEDFTEELYNRAGQDADLAQLIAFFSGGRNDEKLLGVLRQAFHMYEEQPFPKTEFSAGDNIFSSFDQDLLYQTINSKIEEAIEQYGPNLDDPQFTPLTKTALWKSMQQEREELMLAKDALLRRDFDMVGEHICSIKFSSWNTSAKAFAEFKEVLGAPASRRAYAKSLIVSLQKNVFFKSSDLHMKDIKTTAKILTRLFSLIKELDILFTSAKRERAIMSFTDLERLSVKLLIKEYNVQTDTIYPSETALAMREEIDEIIVDEYQDTNRKQDLIFRALSKEGKNIFMVGDVKQSIYRFRAACPELFLEKKKNSSPATEQTLHQPSYLYLNQNFRSHPQILAFANQVFKASMSSRLGQIEYDESEQLNTGGLYPQDSGAQVELDFVMEDETSSQEFRELDAIERQADFVAEKIRSLHGTLFYDVKSGQRRPLKYSDMAIMCRIATGVATHFENALLRRGINCINNNQDQQFLDLWEIKMLRAFLQVVSNPYRDIPLVTLMYSDFYCFSAEDLARIRATDKYIPFYDALRKRAETDEACAVFLKDVEELRYQSVGKRTDEILQMIFARTHILERIASYPDGKARVANMQLMLRYAIDYEKDSYKGLFSFLNYLDKMGAINLILPGARSGQAADQCVHILSVHKSKGLEYPVCFVVNLERGYVNKDGTTLVSHRDFGVALQMREDENFKKYESLPYQLIREGNRRDALSEDMRILYVALTRPKTHLYLVSSVKKDEFSKLLTEISGYCGNHPAEFLSDKPTVLKWILFALRQQKSLQPLYDAMNIIACPQKEECEFDVCICSELSKTEEKKRYAQKVSADVTDAIKLAVKQYPFKIHTKLPIKLSVSEVKGMREQDPEAMPLIPEYFGRKKPTFLSGSVDGNVVGNAVHKFMQYADFKTLATKDGFAFEKKRLLQQEFLTERELAMVDERLVQNFVAQPVFKDMITADRLEKEKRFFFTMPAEDIFENCGQREPILLQGVLDCCYEKNGQLIIVDYKTDRLSSHAEFIDRYGLQLQLYRLGLYDLYGKKADKLYIYSFYLNEVIEIS